MAGFELPVKAIREQVSSAAERDHPGARMSDGTRKIVKVTEVTGMEGEVVVMQDIFVFEKAGSRPGGEGRRPVPGHRRTAEVPRHGPHGGDPPRERALREPEIVNGGQR